MTIPHNNVTFVSKESTKHCLKCACFMGDLECTEPNRVKNEYSNVQIHRFCSNDKCPELLEDKNTKASKKCNDN